MGDRGNIAILFRVGDRAIEQYSMIYLYTHWGGSQIAQALQDALRRAAPTDEDDWGRWYEPAYLTRIIFDSLKGDDPDSPILGFGIAPYVLDNDHPILAVDVYNQEVFVLPTAFGGHCPSGELWRRPPEEELSAGQQPGPGRWSFEEFIAQDFGPPFDALEQN